jgi:quercetin dioxygenase-like cupin family protein
MDDVSRTVTTAAQGGLILQPGAGTALWSMGMLMTVKAGDRDTDSLFSVIEVQLPAGAAPPLHIHHREAELNYLLDGEMRFQCGDAVQHARAGTFVYIPRGVAHAFKAGDAGARMLALTSPAGIEHLYETVGEPAQERVLPNTPPNIPGWLENAARFGIEVIGPPLS